MSTIRQEYGSQLDRLRAAGASKIYEEKRSGLDGDRPELAKCLDFVRDGDTLIVTKLDRLARSTADLYRIVTTLNEKGVAFRVLDDPSVDTSSRTGKLVMGILALIAEFETEIRRERQMEGIARAKAEGRTGGRPKKVTPAIEEAVRALRAQGLSIRKVAAEVSLSKATIQKVITSAKTTVGG